MRCKMEVTGSAAISWQFRVALNASLSYRGTMISDDDGK